MCFKELRLRYMKQIESVKQMEASEQLKSMKVVEHMKVGFTTSIPVEVIFATGHIPIDLNNIFVVSDDSLKMVDEAEIEGFPRNLCSWIKGRYTVALNSGIDVLIGVSEGDCSNTKALMEVLESKGIKVYEFSYPKTRNKSDMKREIENLMQFFDIDWEEVNSVKEALYHVRQKVKELDRLTWEEDKASGFENHLYQVSSSDFNGDYKGFSLELDKKLNEIRSRKPSQSKIRLGYMGVPPIFTDMYENIEELGAKVMFNEVQRQFSFSRFPLDMQLEEMYTEYTYPYTLNRRIEDVNMEVEQRGLDGIIHYTQAFCYRGIEDILVKKGINVPVLSIEGDLPGKVDERTKIRLEAFIDMLKDLK